VKEGRNILHTIRRRKTNWIGHILRRNCLIKQGNKKILEVEGGSSRSHSLENSVWKRLLTCRETDKYLSRGSSARYPPSSHIPKIGRKKHGSRLWDNCKFKVCVSA
jgi:hypothetical protein